MIALADYVAVTAEGNRAMLVSSGFKISPENFSPRIIGAIKNYKVILGQLPGSVKIICHGVKNAILYVFEYSLGEVNENTVWQSIESTTRSCDIYEMKHLSIYSFRIKVRGPRNQIV